MRWWIAILQWGETCLEKGHSKESIHVIWVWIGRGLHFWVSFLKLLKCKKKISIRWPSSLLCVEFSIWRNFTNFLQSSYLNSKIAPKIVLPINGLASPNQVPKMVNHASAPSSCHLGMYHTLGEEYIAWGFCLACKWRADLSIVVLRGHAFFLHCDKRNIEIMKCDLQVYKSKAIDLHHYCNWKSSKFWNHYRSSKSLTF